MFAVVDFSRGMHAIGDDKIALQMRWRHSECHYVSGLNGPGIPGDSNICEDGVMNNSTSSVSQARTPIVPRHGAGSPPVAAFGLGFIAHSAAPYTPNWCLPSGVRRFASALRGPRRQCRVLRGRASAQIWSNPSGLSFSVAITRAFLAMSTPPSASRTETRRQTIVTLRARA